MTPSEIATITRRATPNIVFYVGATVLAVARPTAAAVLYLVIAVFAVLRAPGERRERARAQPSTVE